MQQMGCYYGPTQVHLEVACDVVHLKKKEKWLNYELMHAL